MSRCAARMRWRRWGVPRRRSPPRRRSAPPVDGEPGWGSHERWSMQATQEAVLMGGGANGGWQWRRIAVRRGVHRGRTTACVRQGVAVRSGSAMHGERDGHRDHGERATCIRSSGQNAEPRSATCALTPIIAGVPPCSACAEGIAVNTLEPLSDSATWAPGATACARRKPQVCVVDMFDVACMSICMFLVTSCDRTG